jgi:hypothetical protein
MSIFGSKSVALVSLAVGAALMASAVAAENAAPASPAPTVADVPPPAMASPPKPHKKVTPSVVIIVTNSRAVALTALDATPEEGGKPKTIVSDLAPGKKKSVKVEHGKSCVFDLHGAFADGSKTDSTSVDLCKDKAVNLVE